MTRILLADDERDEREVVRFLLQKYGFDVEVTEAANGREALERLEAAPADILLTDVRMPFLTGTALAARARELWPDIQILFFSGYDDFSYVRQALTVGAVDYILKPLNPEEFRKTMDLLLERLEQSRRERREREQTEALWRGHILTRLLGGADAQALAAECGGLDFLAGERQVLLLQFDAPLFDRPAAESLERAIAAALAGRGYLLLDLTPSQSLVLLEGAGGQAAARRLQQKLAEAAGQPCYVSVSDPAAGPGGLAAAYAQAERALEDRFFYADVYLYPVGDGAQAPQESSKQDDALVSSIETAVHDRDAYSLRRSVGILFDKYARSKDRSQIYIRYLFSQAAETLCRALPACSLQKRQEAVERIYQCKNFSEIQEAVSELAEAAARHLEDGGEPSRHAVQLVRRYIREHYGDELSLELLAQQCYLSPRYLSDLFIRETGCGINKYIKNMRMERARERILGTNRKIQEICREVGYANFSYFCRSFREVYGMSPEAYRQSPHDASPQKHAEISSFGRASVQEGRMEIEAGAAL